MRQRAVFLLVVTAMTLVLTAGPAWAGTFVVNSTGDLGDNNAEANSILSNSIFSNDRLGIDLDGNGVTPNDGDNPATADPDPDWDTGPNNLQNFPFLSSARTGPRTTIIEGTLRSVPNRSFKLQIFKNPNGTDAEGKTFVGQKQVSTDADGVITFTFKPREKIGAGNFITATATLGSDTSEFSAPKLVRSS